MCLRRIYLLYYYMLLLINLCMSLLVTYGVAMDNGRDELKRVAYHIGLSNDKYGVAVILESMLK